MTNNESIRHILLHLGLIEGIGSGTVRFLVDAFSDPSYIQNAYTFHLNDWQSIGLSLSKAQKIYAGLKDSSLLDRELHNLNVQKAHFITSYDDCYPELLRHMHGAPAVLYIQNKIGDGLLKSDYFLACVASRKATEYTYRAAKHFFFDLKKENVCIVSGGAIGGDALIHRAALECGLPTIAIIGSGLSNVYPSSNRRLFDAMISAGGALVSPFCMETQPSPGTFPARNHIIAGMSHATFVFQGAKGSGTLITAQSALAQGREVGALPGLFDHELSHGCHDLISQGALLISCTKDVRTLLGLGEEKVDQKNVSSDISSADVQLNDTQEDILLKLCETPHALNELAEKLNMNHADVQKIVFEYFVAGKVVQDVLGRWKKK